MKRRRRRQRPVMVPVIRRERTAREPVSIAGYIGDAVSCSSGNFHYRALPTADEQACGDWPLED